MHLLGGLTLSLCVDSHHPKRQAVEIQCFRWEITAAWICAVGMNREKPETYSGSRSRRTWWWLGCPRLWKADSPGSVPMGTRDTPTVHPLLSVRRTDKTHTSGLTVGWYGICHSTKHYVWRTLKENSNNGYSLGHLAEQLHSFNITLYFHSNNFL